MPAGSSFARGAAALYALLRAIAQRDGAGEVIIPSICCEAVALAARFAGHKVRFADVSQESLCLTPDSVARAMSSDTRAVLVVHAFGADAGAAGFRRLRNDHPETVFIENVAQAIGGLNRSGQLLGAELDCALLSLADGKIVSGDGGILLYAASNRCPTPEAVEAAIPPSAPRLPQPALALKLRNFVHAFGDRWRAQPDVRPAPPFADVPVEFESLIVCAGGVANEAIAIAGLKGLPGIRARRHSRYRKYRERISNPQARMAGLLHEGGTCWRASVLFEEPEIARKVTSALRSKDIHASNHYLPLHLLFGGEPLPDSEFVGSRIVNVWVDETAPECMIDGAIDIINRSR
ncbi:MAG: DegT/DnrJ/EryC1/StrS family aminotransferase [Candidatus Parcubacteria bacterium]|nr:DegT/DnrJ/EryC1/StrS family aminotransferase [Burkholderiales bacterium]